MIAAFSAIDLMTDIRIWIMLFLSGITSYIMAQYYMRKVMTRVIYHRAGHTVDVLQCFEKQDKISFKTNPDPMTKKKEEITVTKKGLPEIQVSGLKTFKLWHVIENFGNTVDIRDLTLGVRASGSAVSTAITTMNTIFEMMQRAVGQSKGQWMLTIGIGLICFFLGLGWGKVL